MIICVVIAGTSNVQFSIKMAFAAELKSDLVAASQRTRMSGNVELFDLVDEDVMVHQVKRLLEIQEEGPDRSTTMNDIILMRTCFV